MTDIFVSYCQKDGSYIDKMESYFANKNITLHRDIREISQWKSIKEYMQSIRDADYAVLLISDKYLKSFNCMYEVLEAMRDRNYKDKIFPAVLETSIYDTSSRIEYVKYWQDKYKELGNQMSQIDMVNASGLIDDLKRAQNIAASISEFLSLVADMNNPRITDINVAIENKLKEHGILGRGTVSFQSKSASSQDVFSNLNIQRNNHRTEPTDLEKNQFMIDSFQGINKLLGQLCNQLQYESNNIEVIIEKIDTRAVIYQFYNSGNQVKSMKLLLGNTFGGRDMSIAISTDAVSWGSGNSYNGMISYKFENGQLSLYSMISLLHSQRIMTVEETVKDIWESYIQPYI